LTILPLLLLSFAASLVVASFFEWALHRFLMHGVLIRGYPYRAHDRMHHGTVDADRNYQLRHETDVNVIRMAWWNAPVLLLVLASPTALVAAALDSWCVFAAAMAGFIAYYAAYEYLHWCMHRPARRWFERSRWFRWIDIHHRIHHLDPSRNLNVVLPIADWILGTGLARARMT
jgi:hypothetical protein